MANTLVIIASAPLLAACFSSLFLGEKVPPRTWLAIATAMAGVALTVSGSMRAGTGLGDLFASGSAICMAGHFTALRWWRSADGPVAVCTAGLLAALIALPLASPLSPQGNDLFWLPLLGLVVLPLAFGLMAIGPRYLPAAEVSLFLLAETALGPLWVWLVLNEQPSNTTLWGGAIVVGTLMVHALLKDSSAPEPK